SLGDGVGQAQALLVLGEIFSDQARLHEFALACQQAQPLAHAAMSRSVEARAYLLWGTADMMLGQSAEAEAHIDRATELYRLLDDERGIATSLLMQSRIAHLDGRLRDAVTATTDAIALLEALGDRRAVTSACLNLGMIDFERGALP